MILSHSTIFSHASVSLTNQSKNQLPIAPSQV